MGRALFDALTSYEQSEGLLALRRLGGENIEVELQLDDVADALEITKLWLTANVGESRKGKVTLIAGSIAYTLPKDVAVVTEVIPPGESSSTDTVFNDVSYTRRFRTALYRRGGLLGTTQVQDSMYDSMLNRLYNKDVAWSYDRRTRILTVTPDTLAGVCWYEYTAEQIDLERIEAKVKMLFRRYLLAQLKRVLGMVRRKYSEIPMGGSKTSLDGDTLSSDAEIEIAELEEEVKALAITPPFLVG